VGERWKGLSRPEDLPGVDDLLGSFRWYDAFCINQNDPEERSAQVQMMSSIFRNADLVLAWLGPEEDHNTEVLEILKHLSSETVFRLGSPMENFSKPAPQALLDKLGEESSGESVFSLACKRRDEFHHLFRDRPFWNRAWIFLCGPAGFGLSDLGNIVIWIEQVPVDVKPADVEWGPWLELRDDLATGLTFSMRGGLFLSFNPEDIEPSQTPYGLAWIAATQSCLLHATDPRDKVYSLLGLVDIGMKANY
jgi:hypothetical protein